MQNRERVKPIGLLRLVGYTLCPIMLRDGGDAVGSGNRIAGLNGVAYHPSPICAACLTPGTDASKSPTKRIPNWICVFAAASRIQDIGTLADNWQKEEI